jgi:predicted metal-dependent peptidase
MDNTRLTQACRDWLEEVCYRLTRTGGSAYGLFLRRIRVEASPRLVAGRFPAAIGMRPDGTILMRLTWPMLSELPAKAAVELLKHEVLHVVFGHLSGYSRERAAKYGQDIWNIACDLVVNQYIDTGALRACGFNGPTVETYGIERDQTTVWYCEALTSHPRANNFVELKRDFGADYKKSAEETEALGAAAFESDGAEVLGQYRQPGPWECISAGELPPEIVNLNVEHLITEIKSQAGGDKTGRGWDSGEAEEFIAQVRRKPEAPWYGKLRQLESRYRTHTRTPSLLRPSRRHPCHKGRVRESSLLMWFGVDTSGSMDKNRLCLVDSELKGFANRGAAILVLHVDAQVQKKELYDPRKGLVSFVGRGGTDFSPFLLELRALPRHEQPGFAAFFTDGYGCISGYNEVLRKEMGVAAWKEFSAKGSPRTPDGTELLWILTPDSRDLKSFKNEVPFGHYARLKGEKE